MSIRRHYALLLAIALMAASGSLYGCGPSGAITQAAVAKGSVAVTATFPGTSGAVKSLIPVATQAIYVKFQQQGSQQSTTFYDLKLTPTAPTGTIKLAPGNYSVTAYAYDSDAELSGYPSGQQLAYTSTGGVINLGSNTVNLTFLNGTWTLVNAAGNSLPLVLSNGMQLNDLIIGGSYYNGAYKSAFDFTKPIGGGSAMLRYRFSTYTSARAYGSLMTQFVGTTNTNAVSAGMYNLTQKCGESYSDQNTSPCDPASGDQMIMISDGNSAGYDSSSGGAYEGDILYGSAYTLLPNAGETSFTQNGTAIDLMSKLGTSSVSGGTTITGSLVEIIVSSANKTFSTTPSPAKVAPKTVKAQSTNTPYTGITATSYGLQICATKASPNKGTWQFSSQPVTIGTATCYNNGYLSSVYNTGTGLTTMNAGDFSYGLAPTNTADLGDYCHVWDYNPTSATNNTCLKQLPDSGDVYSPYNFRAKKTTTKTAINYGSFKLNFHVVDTMSGTVYVYPFLAKGTAN